MMRFVLIAGLALAAGLLYPGRASAFCVVNNDSTPLSIKVGGGPMPVYVKPMLQPGDRDCYIPRQSTGSIVEIYDYNNQRLRCRQSVPKDSTITVAQTCRVKLD